MTEIIIPKNAAIKKNDRYWQFGIGSCHLALAQRADYLAQLEEAVKELGFKRVRCHGVFHESMNLYQSAAEFMPLPAMDKYVTRSFFEIAKVYDSFLNRGVRPIVELGLMPKRLASGGRTLFKYKMNVTPPRRMTEWSALVKDFAAFLIDRYGKEEVSEWLFEVWNEPDFRFVFWTGTQKKYFELYAATAKALKSVCPDLKVGGPVTTSGTWIKETVDYCRTKGVPLDFVSTHLYPSGEVKVAEMAGGVIGRYMNVLKNARKGLTARDGIHTLMYDAEQLKNYDAAETLRTVERIEREADGIPWYLTEWNANATCTAPEHDTKAAAAYTVKTVLDAQGHMNGCVYWCLSDIFEELNHFPEPFSGSFGLMTVYGVKKPNYHAFRMLAETGAERIILPETDGEIKAAAFTDGSEIQILLHRHCFVPADGKEKAAITVATQRAPLSVTVVKIDDEHCNATAAWRAVGSPAVPTEAQVREINALSAPKEEPLPYKSVPNGIELTAALGVNDVHFIKIKLN